MEKIISPAVTFKETDLTTIPQEFDQIDGVFVGPTPKGRYFVPTTVNSFREYEEKFGGVSDEDYTGLAVREYIREKGSATVVPVANTEGYTNDQAWNLQVTSGSTTLTVAQIYLTQGGQNNAVDSASVTGSLENFDLTIFSGSTQTSAETDLSLYDSDTNFLGEINNPTSTNKDIYVKYIVDINNLNDSAGGFGVGNTVSASSTDISLAPSSAPISGSAYQEATSPWVISQDFGTDNYYKLFRFRSLQHGDLANRKLKFVVSNVRLPSELNDPDAKYGLFDITIRDYSDTEGSPEVLETFEDLSLNPDSNDYIVRQIGDKRQVFDSANDVLQEEGLYDNASDFVWVEVNSALDDVPANAVPFGFESYNHAGDFFVDGQAPSYLVYPDNADGKVAGVDFDGLKDFYLDSLHKELPKSDSEAGFYDDGSDDTAEYFVMTGSVTDISDDADREFIFGAFGGSKGDDETKPKNTGDDMTSSNTFGLDFSSATSNGSLSYKRALDILSDDETYDLSLLVMPAINIDQHSWITGQAINMVEERADVFLVLDATGVDGTNNEAELAGQSFDSTYAGCYYPWVNVNNAGKVEPVPPSVLVPSAFAYNDKVAHPWYATLGFNRGTLANAVKPYKKLRKATRDDLIQANVNPITSILGEGTVILGQETLQKRETALSKINVRRLLIEAKKFISTVAWKTIGEPNNATTRGQLESIINNYLEGVRRDNGLEKFKVDFSESVNTADVVNRNLVRGVIQLVPTKAVEGIQIEFVLRNSGVSFND